MKRMSSSKAAVKRKALTLKDFPEDLIWQAKLKATTQHMTLKAFIIAALERAIREG